MPVSFEGYNFGSRSDLSSRSLFDAAKQASRHAWRKAVGTGERATPSTRSSDKHGGRTSRVGTSDDDDLVVVAKLRFLHEGCAVVDAGTFELRQIGECRLTISGACGDDHCASGNGRAVTQSHAVMLGFAG